jgi:hypothetical protein
MCIHPENEMPNVISLTGRRAASPWIGQTSTKAAVIRPEVASWVDSSLPEPSPRERELFDVAEHHEFEDRELKRLGEMSTTDWLRIACALGGWFAFVVAVACFLGYVDARGWVHMGALVELSKWVP